ncbi:MAG: aspartate aminotransferase family protein [Acidimicrobiia bacterium]|nr:aspartate aminotransferase family protein [Acidimicrobiia bacterium]
MTPDEFRRQGAAAVEWVARYMEEVERYPVLSQVAPGDIRARLAAHPPERPEAFEDILADVGPTLLDGITHWQSPNFFAYFPANASGPSVLGELLSAGLGVQGMLWATSPACTELETHVLDWMAELCGLPERFRSTGPGGGVIQDSASSAVLCALLAARARATEGGTRLEDLQAYTSTQAHSSVAKAARIAGLRDDQLTLVGVDGDYALDAEALGRAMAGDARAGRAPFLVVATVGTTSSMAIDPVAAVVAAAAGHGAWVHVDAAMSGPAAICPEFRWVTDGLEGADSCCTNPHKWLFTNFDCDCFWVADRAPLLDALSILPEFLRNAASESGAVIDYRDWQVPLGRRFRALKLWFVLRWYGGEGLRHHVREHVALARELVGWVQADPRFVLAAPAPLNLVCIRHTAGDEATQSLLDQVNASGRAYLSHTRLDERLVLRISIGATATERRHVLALWQLLSDAADVVSASPSATPPG